MNKIINPREIDEIYFLLIKIFTLKCEIRVQTKIDIF